MARRLDLIIINKKREHAKLWTLLSWLSKRVKLKESEKKNKYLDLARGLKKTVLHESDVYTNYNWCSSNSHQRISKRTRGLENNRTSGEHPNYYITEIGENTEKSPGDLRRLDVTRTLNERPSALADVKNSQ